jgi:hypothetical protein
VKPGLLALAVLGVALAGCGGGGGSSPTLPASPGQPSGQIVVNPAASQTAPSAVGCAVPFYISATEAGYVGTFTIVMSANAAFGTPVVTPQGEWEISPTSACSQTPATVRFTVEDRYGNKAATYISNQS